MGFISDAGQRVRRLIPVSALPAVGRRRTDALWANDAFRESQEQEMRFLLEHTSRASEIPEIARRYTEFSLLRGYRRWHPRHLCTQPVAGIEWLTTERDPDRGVLLSFVHHGQYEGLGPSLGRHGVEVHTVVADEAFEAGTPLNLRQHFKVAAMGATLVPASIGTAGMIDLLRNKKVLSIASDVAGRTPIDFLGRRINGSFGAARVAAETSSPVVLVTSHRGPDGLPSLQVHEPLEPADFADPGELLQEMMTRHGEAVLAWPEAFDSPYGRWGLTAGSTL